MFYMIHEARAGSDQILCGPFIFRNSHVSLTETEKRLVCGDPQGSEPWRKIPVSQALFHLRTFLQSRGYHRSKSLKENDKWVIEAGVPTTVSRVAFQGMADTRKLLKLRKIVGEILTPPLLDSVTARVSRTLQAMGFGCPKVDVEGDPDTGEILVKIDSGSIQNVLDVSEEPVDGVNEEIFRRYDAFQMGKRFDGDHLQLTQNRILSLGLVQSTYFSARCEAEGVLLRQKSVGGPPRRLTLGIGINTEKGPLARVTWRNARMGQMASQIELSVNAWFRNGNNNGQEFSALGSWYPLSRPSRFYLKPIFSVKHESTEPREFLLVQLQLGPATTWDSQNLGLSATLGPRLNVIRTARGTGMGDSTFLSLSGSFTLMSHPFELYRTSPRCGFELNLSASLSQKGWLSGVTAQALHLDFQNLFNFLNEDPPFFVIGFRGGISTTITAESLTSASLPAIFRYHLGGSKDLRGFSLLELPDAQGALTAGFSSLEFRFPYTFPWGLQPLFFVDLGMTGKQFLSLDGALYWSPGLGLRWETGIGVFRGTVANGFINSRSRAHPQFYLSYGEEF